METSTVFIQLSKARPPLPRGKLAGFHLMASSFKCAFMVGMALREIMLEMFHTLTDKL
jgi:hypothetical protein